MTEAEAQGVWRAAAAARLGVVLLASDPAGVRSRLMVARQGMEERGELMNFEFRPWPGEDGNLVLVRVESQPRHKAQRAKPKSEPVDPSSIQLEL